MKLTSIFLAGLVMIPALNGTQEATGAQEPAAPAVRSLSPFLEPGDEVDVRLYDLPDIGGSALHVYVLADGTIHLPYAGTVQAAGLTPEGLEAAVSDALRNRGIVKAPNVSVSVVSAVNMQVQVIGQVKTPKSIQVYSPVPVSYVIGQVGGINGLASHHLTIIHRGDESPTTLDYDPDSPSSTTMNTLVRPGDIVNVSQLGVYFIAGEVSHPGVFPLGGALSVGGATVSTGGLGIVKDITLLQALAQAGGITSIAARSKMHILRTVDGKRINIIVDQVKLSKGEVADPILHANDIIYVPSSYIRAQTNNLFSTALTSLYAGIQLNSTVNR